MSFTLSASFRSACFAKNLRFPQRLYSKNVLRRRPVRVLNVPSDIEPINNETFSPKTKLSFRTAQDTGLEEFRMKDHELIVPGYEKLEKDDPRFTKTLGIIKSKHLRDKKGLILLEGKRLINDAIAASVKLRTIYFSRERDLAAIQFRDQNKADIFKVLYNTMKVWSDLTTCPGVMGVFQRPTTEDVHILSEPAIPVTVLCDNIRDPGNLGSIIRNAAAAGCENILLMKGCVDPWESKVLKTGCGGHFRIPIIYGIEWTHISNYLHKDSTIFIADNSADIEGHSVSSEFMSFDEDVLDKDDDDRFVAVNEHDQQVVVDMSYDEPTELEKYKEMQFPCHLYSSFRYPKKSVVLYVGGETHGVDPRAVKLACEFGGKKLKIPLENNVDSLNSAFAATLILYEIKRQLVETYVTK